MSRPDIVDIEYDLWRALCALLKETRLVTPEDLRSPVAECKTEGQKLLRAIRAWGEDPDNDIGRATINRQCRDQAAVFAAIREWAQSARTLKQHNRG